MQGKLVPLTCVAAVLACSAPAPEAAPAPASVQTLGAPDPSALERWGVALAERNRRHELLELPAGALDLPEAARPQWIGLSRGSQRCLWDLEALRSIPRAPQGPLPWAELASEQVVGPLQTLVHTARQLERLGVDFLVVPVPPRAAIFPELVDGGSPRLRYDVGLRELYRHLEERGVEVLDLLPAFLAERARVRRGRAPADAPTTELVVLRQDIHWSSFGSELAAREIARRIRRYEWAEELFQSLGRAELVEDVRWHRNVGSIFAGLRRQERVPEGVQPLPWSRRVSHIVGERWSRRDPESPIVLLGDSFSRPEYSLPQHLLRELGFRVDRFSVPSGNQSGQLARLAQRRDVRSKRLVIWQIAAPAWVGIQKWRATDLVRGDHSQAHETSSSSP